MNADGAEGADDRGRDSGLKRDADGQRLAMALMAAYDAGKAAGEKKKEQEAE